MYSAIKRFEIETHLLLKKEEYNLPFKIAIHLSRLVGEEEKPYFLHKQMQDWVDIYSKRSFFFFLIILLDDPRDQYSVVILPIIL